MFLLLCVAFCESDAAVPKPRQTRWIYIKDHSVITSFVKKKKKKIMAIGESLK